MVYDLKLLGFKVCGIWMFFMVLDKNVLQTTFSHLSDFSSRLGRKLRPKLLPMSCCYNAHTRKNPSGSQFLMFFLECCLICFSIADSICYIDPITQQLCFNPSGLPTAASF